MEGEGEPAEIGRIKRDLAAIADASADTGAWLAQAMEASWGVAESLIADLAGERRAPGYLFSASELIDRAADLGAESAALVHENERRWRVFRDRVEELTDQAV